MVYHDVKTAEVALNSSAMPPKRASAKAAEAKAKASAKATPSSKASAKASAKATAKASAKASVKAAAGRGAGKASKKDGSNEDTMSLDMLGMLDKFEHKEAAASKGLAAKTAAPAPAGVMPQPAKKAKTQAAEKGGSDLATPQPAPNPLLGKSALDPDVQQGFLKKLEGLESLAFPGRRVQPAGA